jgi:hypothetical protein
MYKPGGSCAGSWSWSSRQYVSTQVDPNKYVRFEALINRSFRLYIAYYILSYLALVEILTSLTR